MTVLQVWQVESNPMPDRIGQLKIGAQSAKINISACIICFAAQMPT